MPSLTPRRNYRTHKPVLPDGVAFACIIKARLPDLWISRLLLRSLSLRPGCLLTALATALSTGSRRSIALPPAVRATRLWAFVMMGLSSHRMHLPFLDARWGCIKSRGKRGPRPGYGIAMGLTVSSRWQTPTGPRNLVGVKSLASPFGAKRFTGQPSHRRRKRQSSSELALKPAGGRFMGLERFWQVVHGLQSRLLCSRLWSRLAFDGDCWGSGRVHATT